VKVVDPTAPAAANPIRPLAGAQPLVTAMAAFSGGAGAGALAPVSAERYSQTMLARPA
jgi:hypothetical protein